MDNDELIPKRLRHRVRVLGELLGESMTQQLGEDFLAEVENIRHLAKRRRQEGNAVDKAQLRALIHRLDDENLVSIARAFNQFLNLTNIAEQAETSDAHMVLFPSASRLAALFSRLAESDQREQIESAVRNVRCELVLTAHPTEITRRTLIQKYNRIAEQLDAIEVDRELNAAERIELERLVAEVWYTDELRTERPTPQDEAKWGYAVIEHSFWDAIPRLWLGLDQLVYQYTGSSLPLSTVPIKIDSWMGGDRDGNPNVTSEVTDEVIRLARWMASDLYLRDIDELLSQLSMSVCDEKIRSIAGGDTSEPYRIVLRELRKRLIATREWAETFDAPNDDVILHPNELYTPLLACYDSLYSCGMGIIADGLLKKILIRVSTFGVTLVDLDVRQNADKHEALMNELTEYLKLGSYRDWSEKARQDFLADELESRRPLIPPQWKPTPEVQETLNTFRLIADNNAEGIAGYIVSMAKNPSDVLVVVLLFKMCGMTKKLPVVPLFETHTDLENAAWTLERLLRIPQYTRFIEGSQQVMIGYSDSAKDVGQMAAAWAQYRAQEDLVEIAEKYHVDLTLFHGRGGTPGRGGGPARAAILAQPPGSVKHCMRVTEQGEVIRFKYGSEALALQSMDMALSATLEASLLPPARPRKNWRLLMDRLAEAALEAYEATVKQHPLFNSYFDQGTPEKELAKLALGSRPARRTEGSRNIADLRAIPWVFAWTQKRLMLPAWLGTDAALALDLSRREQHILREMVMEWPFFQTQLDMLEMVLSKADVELSEEYDLALIDEDHQAIGVELRARLTELVANVNRLKDQTELLAGSPEIRTTLELRHPYTDPLHFLQTELIRRSREQDTESSDDNAANEQVDKALMVTIAGIAAGMRNTG